MAIPIIPKKNKINQRMMDKGLKAHIEETSFEITLNDGEKEYTITFQTFIDPVIYHIARTRAIDAISKDEEYGWTIMTPVLETTIHTIIFEFLSNVTFPVEKDDDGEKRVDLAKIGTYGTYLKNTDIFYMRLFDDLYDNTSDYLETIILNHRASSSSESDLTKFVDAIVGGISLFQDLVNDPEAADKIMTLMQMRQAQEEEVSGE